MKLRGIFFVFVILSLVLTTADANAARGNAKYASLVVDADSGTILHNEYGEGIRHPASLTKLMTLYLSFEALKNHKMNLNETVWVSRHAASQPRMSLALKTGDKITVKNLIDSVVVVSANDSAVVLAERLGKTENNFARMMTQRARQLGMKNTTFMNASGLHNPRQVTTAIDMAKMLMALKRDFPQYYPMLSKNFFAYKGVEYGAHSSLLKNYQYTKAGKTGFVNASGFNLVLNAEKNGNDLVGVVLGGRTAATRDNFMKNLLERNFNKLAGRTVSGGTKLARNYSVPSKPAFTKAAN